MKHNPISRLTAYEAGELHLNDKELKHCLVWAKLFRNGKFFDAHIEPYQERYGTEDANVMLLSPRLREIYEGHDLKDEPVELALVSFDPLNKARDFLNPEGHYGSIWECLRLREYNPVECIATIQDYSWKLNIWQWDMSSDKTQVTDIGSLLSQTTYAMYAEDRSWGVRELISDRIGTNVPGFRIPSYNSFPVEWEFIKRTYSLSAINSRTYQEGVFNSIRTITLGTDSESLQQDSSLKHPLGQLIISNYPFLTSVLSQLSASDASTFLAVNPPNILSSRLRAKYLHPIRDLPDCSWLREKISEGFEVYLTGLQAGLLWKRIHQPLYYWATHGTKVLRVWAVAISPDAERRRSSNPDGNAYVVDKNWEVESTDLDSIIYSRNRRPDRGCGSPHCSGCPFWSALLPPPFVYEATTNCTPGGPKWFRFKTGNRIELTWGCCPSYNPPAIMEVCCHDPGCGMCDTEMSDIGGIKTWEIPSVPYICLSSRRLGVSTFTIREEVPDIDENVAFIKLWCENTETDKGGLLIKRLTRDSPR